MSNLPDWEIEKYFTVLVANMRFTYRRFEDARYSGVLGEKILLTRLFAMIVSDTAFTLLMFHACQSLKKMVPVERQRRKLPVRDVATINQSVCFKWTKYPIKPKVYRNNHRFSKYPNPFIFFNCIFWGLLLILCHNTRYLPNDRQRWKETVLSLVMQWPHDPGGLWDW